jgi:fumarate hydratase subunit alpha
MREITFKRVAQAVEGLCEKAAHELPEDVLEALKNAAVRESNAGAARILNQLIENARLANSERIPLCQDTGLAVVFVEQGADVAIKSGEGKIIIDAINEGVAAGYENGYLRKSIVSEPLNERKNTKTNTPPVIHYSIVHGDKLKITIMAKGGGCENKSQFKMFKPTASRQEVIEWITEVVRSAGADACPPFVVGVGIGGNFEYSCLLSKKAILRTIGEKNGDKFYAQMEDELLSAINRLGAGPMGLGGDTTALGCAIEIAPCHIASLPVAVNIECHSHRHKTAVI